MYYYNENNEINLDSAVLFKLHNVLLQFNSFNKFFLRYAYLNYIMYYYNSVAEKVPCSLLKFKLHNVLLQSEACVYDIDYEDPFKLHNVLLQCLKNPILSFQIQI